MSAPELKKAFVFAAGLGTRMRPITNKIPKPLAKIAGKTLLDWTLQTLIIGGIEEVVINTHYKAEQINQHIKNLKTPLKIALSHEETLLETGGGVIKMLDFFAAKPFLTVNTDVIFIPHKNELKYNPVIALRESWDMKSAAHLLLVKKSDSLGYDDAGDFDLVENKIYKTPEKTQHSHVYSGIQIVTPEFLKNPPGEIFSLNHFFKINHQKDGGFSNMSATEFRGKWLHIGTPEAIAQAENFIAQL